MDQSLSFGGDVNYEYLILGAGPAGLQMGHHLSRAGLSYLILEAGDGPGTFFRKFPRHRTLNSSNKVHTGSTDPEVNLRFDWNSLLDEDGDGEHALHPVQPPLLPAGRRASSATSATTPSTTVSTSAATPASCASRSPTPTSSGSPTATGSVFSCRRLIVATGAGKPYVPEIPGIDQAETYADVSIDPEDFVNQRVLILGKGNSALETADNLIPTAALIHVASPHPLKLAWKTPLRRPPAGGEQRLPRHLPAQPAERRARLRRRADRAARRPARGLGAPHPRPRRGRGADLRPGDRCTGFRFDDSIFAAECRPELVHNRRFPAQTPEWESVNVPGLYFAGTLTQANDFRKHASAFIHGFRYNARALFRMLQSEAPPPGVAGARDRADPRRAGRGHARPPQPRLRDVAPGRASSTT